MKSTATFQELSSSYRTAHKFKYRSGKTALACSHSHTQAYTSVKYRGPPFTRELLLGSWKTDSNQHLREWEAAECTNRDRTIGIGKYHSSVSWFRKLLRPKMNEGFCLVCFSSDHNTYLHEAFSLSMWSAVNLCWAWRGLFWGRGLFLGWQPFSPRWCEICSTLDGEIGVLAVNSSWQTCVADQVVLGCCWPSKPIPSQLRVTVVGLLPDLGKVTTPHLCTTV